MRKAGWLILLGMLAAVSTVPGAMGEDAKSPLLGGWRLVSLVNLGVDGRRAEPDGPTAKGLLVLLPTGDFTFTLLGGELSPPGNSRRVGAPSFAYFGKYAIVGDELDFHLDASTQPDWTGGNQKRAFTLSGDALEIRTLVTPLGGGSIWTFQRLK